MPVSLTWTTTRELPVVTSHACGAETCSIHHCSGNNGSFGVTANNVRGSRSSRGSIRSVDMACLPSLGARGRVRGNRFLRESPAARSDDRHVRAEQVARGGRGRVADEFAPAERVQAGGGGGGLDVEAAADALAAAGADRLP